MSGANGVNADEDDGAVDGVGVVFVVMRVGTVPLIGAIVCDNICAVGGLGVDDDKFAGLIVSALASVWSGGWVVGAMVGRPPVSVSAWANANCCVGGVMGSDG